MCKILIKLKQTLGGVCNLKLLVFCTQTNTWTRERTDKLIQVYPRLYSFGRSITIADKCLILNDLTPDDLNLKSK